MQLEFAIQTPRRPVTYRPVRELKVVTLRECPVESPGMETPDQVRDYHDRFVRPSPWFDPMKENLVVFLLNARRRCIGHNLVSIGLLDTVTVHAREVFRPAIAAAASTVVLTHNLCAATHKLCYVEFGVMCSDRLAVLTSAWVPRRKEYYA